MNKFLEFILIVVVPLISGILIYIFGGYDVYYFLKWFKIELPNTLKLSSWLIFNLPDGLWLFSLINVFIFIWKDDHLNFFKWSLFTLFFSISSEFLQKIELIHGTFDLNDIFTYLIAFLFSISIYIVNYFLKFKIL